MFTAFSGHTDILEKANYKLELLAEYQISAVTSVEHLVNRTGSMKSINTISSRFFIYIFFNDVDDDLLGVTTFMGEMVTTFTCISFPDEALQRQNLDKNKSPRGNRRQVFFLSLCPCLCLSLPVSLSLSVRLSVSPSLPPSLPPPLSPSLPLSLSPPPPSLSLG